MNEMKNLEHQVQDALNAIENTLDPKIWQTKLRIQEIIMKEYPNLKDNIFVCNLNHLLTLLIAGVQIGEIIAGQFPLMDGERYAEGEIEPILLTDIPQETYYGTPVEFSERIYISGMLDGLHFKEIKAQLQQIKFQEEVKILSKAHREGLQNGRVFYKSVQTPKNRSNTHQPSLTMNF